MRVMDAVLILFNLRLDPVVMDPEKNSVKPSWSESLKLMSQTSFLPQLMNFQKVSSHFYYVQTIRMGNFESLLQLKDVLDAIAPR